MDSDLVCRADAEDRLLAARVHLTDELGGPRCARLEAPAITFELGSAAVG